MKEFAKSIPVVGRVQVEILDDVDVSIVNPSQYRNELIELISKDIAKVTASLGGTYRVVVSGIDGPVQWAKSSSVNLDLFINYSYTVIPSNVSTVVVEQY